MSTKHRTKIVGMPTKIVTIPLLECDVDIIKKMHRHNPSKSRGVFNETQYWIIFKSDERNCYFAFSVPLSELEKKNTKKITGTLSTRGPHGGFYTSGKFTAPADKLFVVYIENKFSKIYSADDIIDDYQDYIGTDKTLDSDWVISCGQDFNYEQPYGQMVLQPNLKGKYIDLRKKFADDPKITFYFEKKQVKLFRDVQKLLIEKYKAVGKRKRKITKDGRSHDDGFELWELQNEFPTSTYSHLKEPIIWSYLYIGNTCSDTWDKNKKIRVKSGDSDDRSIGDLYKRSLDITVKSLKQVEDFLDEYSKYVKLVRPKQNIL